MKNIKRLLIVGLVLAGIFSCKKFLSVDPPYTQDAENYFNPASMVKMPLAFLAMEKLYDTLISHLLLTESPWPHSAAQVTNGIMG